MLGVPAMSSAAAPVCTDSTFTMAENTTANNIPTHCTDPDGDALSYQVFAPNPGAAFVAGGGLLGYEPPTGFHGTAIYHYKACDNATTCDSNEATITITVTSQPPMCPDYGVATIAGSPTPIRLECSDPENDALTLGPVTQPAHGTLVATATGSNFAEVTYTPNAGYAGPDSFTYKATDGFSFSNIGTVSITVAALKCANGIDDDGNGQIDFPDDLGCTSATDNSEASGITCPATGPTGTKKADTLIGTASSDRLSGGAGDDFLSGEGGKDCLFGEAGSDTVYGGAGDDRLRGGAGGDILGGDGGADEIYGDEGGDQIEGGDGADAINGGDGTDTILAGPGADRIVAKDGKKDTVDCGAGADSALVDAKDSVTNCETVTH